MAQHAPHVAVDRAPLGTICIDRQPRSQPQWRSGPLPNARRKRPPSKRNESDGSERSPRRKAPWMPARRKHEKNAADIQAQIEALEERSRAEIAHWEKKKARLEAAFATGARRVRMQRKLSFLKCVSPARP